MLERRRSPLSRGTRSKLGILAIFCIFLLVPAVGHAKVISGESDYDIGIKAYIYAYPMVLMETTRLASTTPDNTLSHVRTFADPKETHVVRPNVDTLYTVAYLDLSSGPITLRLPDMGERFYVIQLMDWWTDTFADMGTRASGNSGQTFTIVGPGWPGCLDDIGGGDVNIIHSPTEKVWLLGRIYSDGTPADLAIVNKLQNEMGLFGRGVPRTQNISITDQQSTGLTPPQVVAQMDAATFFETFASLLSDNRPHQEDWPMRAILHKIGINPGLPFHFSKLGASTRAALTSAATDAQKIITQYIVPKVPGTIMSGCWRADTQFAGSYGAAYAYRAYVARFGLGANIPADAIYPQATVAMDAGINNYTIHFPNGGLPPALGFWSITMYDKAGYLVVNPLNRYAVRSSDNLKYNADGSMDLYIQSESPGTDLESNWLPAPDGPCALAVRLYWPTTGVLYGSSTWQMPPIVAQTR